MSNPTSGFATCTAVPPVPVTSVGNTRLGLVCVTEALDIESSARFLGRALPIGRGCRCLVVDLMRADFVDSTGVRTLLRLATELEADGRELRLVVRSGSAVERTLSLLKLMERFQVCATIAEACAPRMTPA